MTLILHVIRCPDHASPERRTVGGGDYSIGRGPDNDWTLSDPDKHLSKRHCVLSFRAGRWEIADSSANGTFLNGAAAPVGARAVPLESGDRFRLGAWEIEVEIDDRAASFDPFADEAPATGSFAARDEPAIAMPDDFNPFATTAPFAGPTQSDHMPSLNDAFRPPKRPAAAIPDDWDLDLSDVAAPPPATLRSTAGPTPPTPPSFQTPPPAPPQPPPSSPAPVAQAGPAAGGEALLAAFLRGAGMTETSVGDPERLMEAMGAALRATVAGIRETMIARAAIKSEFRIEQTMIRATGNNPLKFSAGDDDALASMLGSGRRTMPAAEAIAEALRDMRLHELATVNATGSAVRAVLAMLAPATIEKDADRGGLAVLPGQRKARAWEAFEAAHRKITAALEDDFDSVFGKNFARTYEQSLRELQDAERGR